MPSVYWPVTNVELLSLDSRRICLVQHPSGSTVDPGGLEAARHRADYSLHHYVQHPYGLCHEELEEKDLPACKLPPRIWRKFLPPDTLHSLPQTTCVKGPLDLPALNPRSASSGLFGFSTEIVVNFWNGFQEEPYIVADVDVWPLRKQQLHQLNMLVLGGPDHRRPASIILWEEKERVRHAEWARWASCWLHKPLGNHSRVQFAWEPQIPFPPQVCLITLLWSTLLQGEVPQRPAEPSVIWTNTPQQARVYLQLSTLAIDIQVIQIQLTVQKAQQTSSSCKSSYKSSLRSLGELAFPQNKEPQCSTASPHSSG